jgi:hypothetical protein
VYTTAATRHLIISLLSQRELAVLARVNKATLRDVAQILYREAPYALVKEWTRARVSPLVRESVIPQTSFVRPSTRTGTAS